ncbi:MAG: hypothetical protein ABSF14_14290 [Terriglobia bacterium]|jgi:hypothetical protein
MTRGTWAGRAETTIRYRADGDFRAEASPDPARNCGSDRLMEGRSYMDSNPFSHTAKAQDVPASPRRSTRIEFVTPVFLSGRDATGQPFRELTQTALVNLHGCRMRTSYRVLVGMLVTLECPKAGTMGKAVCVKVWDPAEGVAGHEIAVQLIKPQNIWGVPNPPADWESVAKSMVQGRLAPTEHPPRAVASAPAAVVPVRMPPPAISTVDQRLAEFERRAQQLVESVLEILRTQAEELTRSSLEEFRAQVDVLIRDAEERLREGSQQSYEESAASLIGLRADLTEQMTSRSAQLIRSADEALRTRFRELFGTQSKAVPPKPTEQASRK